MNRLKWILLLAVLWCLMQGSITIGQFLIGLVVGTLTLFLAAPSHKEVTRTIRFIPLLRLVLHLMIDLTRSSGRVAWDVLTPTARARPRILAVPVDLDEVGITVMANGVTLTPGSLTLDTNADGTILYVHDMYAEDAEKARAAVSKKLARLVGEAFPDERHRGAQ